MFFNNIAIWTKKKLRGLNVLFGLLHFIALVLIPVIIVACNYKLFAKADGLKLTAMGIIVVIILGLYSYLKIKKAVDKLPQIKLSHQRFKFTLQTILSLVPIIITLFALNVAKNDFNTAINVIKWCSVSFIGGVLIDGLFLKYFEQEIAIRSKALEMVEIEKRKGLV